ncbi:MAG: hypothetical protein IJT98_05510 [Prevotella sp.]|nr:hypothetical protein [Prevotella sp.]
MSIDEEILLDEQETQREMAYIRQVLPIDTKDTYSDDSLLSWVLDAIAAYYYESGVLESTADEVDVDMEEVARYVCALAEQEGKPSLDVQEVRLIAEADLDFQEDA